MNEIGNVGAIENSLGSDQISNKLIKNADYLKLGFYMWDVARFMIY